MVTGNYIGELNHHWFKLWLDAYSSWIHYEHNAGCLSIKAWRKHFLKLYENVIIFTDEIAKWLPFCIGQNIFVVQMWPNKRLTCNPIHCVNLVVSEWNAIMPIADMVHLEFMFNEMITSDVVNIDFLVGIWCGNSAEMEKHTFEAIISICENMNRRGLDNMCFSKKGELAKLTLRT